MGKKRKYPSVSEDGVDIKRVSDVIFCQDFVVGNFGTLHVDIFSRTLSNHTE